MILMNSKNFHTESFGESNIDARGRVRRYQAHQDKHRRHKHKQDEDFISQNIDVKDYVISPDGYETIMVAVYFVTLPYLAGLMFLFMYIADADFEKFQMIDFTTLFIVWMIGYEVLSSIFLLFIFVAFLRSFGRSSG